MHSLISCSHQAAFANPIPPMGTGKAGRAPREQRVFARLSELPQADLLARAAEYRRMAATATTADVRDALLGAAEGWEAIISVASGTKSSPVGSY